MMLNVHRNRKACQVRDGEKAGAGWGRGGGGDMEVGEEGEGEIYTYRYTVTTRMTPALTEMGSDESHFSVSVGSDGQSQDSDHKPQPFYTGHFDRNRFTCSCKRVGGGLRKGGGALMIYNLALLLVVFKVTPKQAWPSGKRLVNERGYFQSGSGTM